MAVWLSPAFVPYCLGIVELIVQSWIYKSRIKKKLLSFEFRILDKIEDTTAFIGLSFAVRVIEALGSAAFLTAA